MKYILQMGYFIGDLSTSQNDEMKSFLCLEFVIATVVKK